APVPGGDMAFSALGTNIFIDTNTCSRGNHAPPTFVYDTKTNSLTAGPRVPDRIHDLSRAMAVSDDRLYALTVAPLDPSPSLQALSWAPTTVRDPHPWEPDMEWSWNTVPSPQPPPYDGTEVIGYALHPDGRTIFMSSADSTHSWDATSAYFDGGLDAWVGLHRRHHGCVCCCPVASRSSVSATQPLGCKMLVDKLACRKEEDPKHWPLLRDTETSLAYMGDSSFVLLENIPRSNNYRDGAVLHVTLFGLRYDRNGELRTKDQRSTRSYAMSKNTPMFSHAAFWM
ncbi:hypothetical protein BS78_K008500, partial [Paspalum vaginatum]